MLVPTEQDYISLSRRSVLTATGGVLALGSIAGCNARSGATYSLSAFEEEDNSLVSALRWTPDDEREARILDQMVAGESVDLLDAPLTKIYHWGDDIRAMPRFVERNRTYYRLRIASWEVVNVNRWVFWLDKVDGEPSDNATVVTSPPEKLDQYDTEAFEYALESTVSHGDFVNPEGDDPRDRGWVFEKDDAEQSDLIPDPPFTHVKVSIGSGDRKRTAYYAVRSEKLTIESRSYTYVADPVAESADEFRAYLHDEFLQSSFTTEDLSNGEREIMNTLVSGAVTGSYRETAPLSEEFNSLLRRMGLADQDPEGKITIYSGVYFEYNDTPYSVSLRIEN